NCKEVTAADISERMLERTKKKCAAYKNVTVRKADILHLPFPDQSFDKVIAANVIHLLDEPEKALKELLRVCKEDGMIILPTYVNKKDDGDITVFSKTVGKAGADVKKEFTLSSYETFLKEEGVEAEATLIKGRVPCAFAVIRRNHETQKL
ncbi:MAG: class I SAM-dependent methyltransferase, partial [Erysipelotrichaceae bacterium]|nr:class I SAM-dependent methyltransferase [Erysipelotrichaceae bacterium]